MGNGCELAIPQNKNKEGKGLANPFDKEKSKLLWEYVLAGKKVNIPKIEIFAYLKNKLGASEAVIGQTYYNYLRHDPEFTEYDPPEEICNELREWHKERGKTSGTNWTKEEDDFVREEYERMIGTGKTVAEIFEEIGAVLERTPKGCQFRYYNSIAPDRKDRVRKNTKKEKRFFNTDNLKSWTEEEDRLLLEAVKEGLDMGLAKGDIHRKIAAGEFGDPKLHKRNFHALAKRFIFAVKNLPEEEQQQYQSNYKNLARRLKTNGDKPWTTEEEECLIRAILNNSRQFNGDKSIRDIVHELLGGPLKERTFDATTKKWSLLQQKESERIKAIIQELAAEEIEEEKPVEPEQETLERPAPDPEAPEAEPDIEREPETPEPIEKPQEAQEATEPGLKIDPAIVEALELLPGLIHDLSKRVETLENKEAAPPEITPEMVAKAILGKPDIEKELSETKEALSNERSDLSNVRAENERLKFSLKQIKGQLDEAQELFKTFTEMATVSQIMSLGDFKTKMQSTIDKWGNVIGIQFERDVESK